MAGFLLTANYGLLAIIALLLLAWIIVGYALFREYRKTRPDWHERSKKN